MKWYTIILGLGLAFNAIVAKSQVGAPVNIRITSTTDFVQPLTPLGTWVEVSGHGRCWHPGNVPGDWRPYANGQWVWTDAGWYWQSDEPWAWACYHYGAWVDDPNYGWIWVPAVHWAPSWVVWRVNDNYVGWAPSEPDGTTVTAALFVFVDIHRFNQPCNVSELIANNPSVVNQTRVVNNTTTQTVNINGAQQTIMANTGPDVTVIQRATGITITPRPVQEVIQSTSTSSQSISTQSSTSAGATMNSPTNNQPQTTQPQTTQPMTQTPQSQRQQFQSQQQMPPQRSQQFQPQELQQTQQMTPQPRPPMYPPQPGQQFQSPPPGQQAPPSMQQTQNMEIRPPVPPQGEQNPPARPPRKIPSQNPNDPNRQ